MPELSDVEAYLHALRARVIDQPLLGVRVASAFLLRTAQPPLSEAEGRLVTGVSRLGKRAVLELEDDLFLVIHLMIAGRLHWKASDVKLSGRNPLAAFDFPGGSLTLTEAGSKRRASLHVVSGLAALAELDPGGLDVFSATLTEFRERMTRANRTIKRALTDPGILSGIGNSYSDEILHAARLSGLQQTAKLTPEQWQALYDATRSTLILWRDRFLAEAADRFPEKVTAFRESMAVNGRFGQPCPVCSDPVQRIRFADNETNYCAPCQTGGKLLADRSLSRLPGKDWPKTLDVLETLKRGS